MGVPVIVGVRVIVGVWVIVEVAAGVVVLISTGAELVIDFATFAPPWVHDQFRVVCGLVMPAPDEFA